MLHIKFIKFFSTKDKNLANKIYQYLYALLPVNTRNGSKHYLVLISKFLSYKLPGTCMWE